MIIDNITSPRINGETVEKPILKIIIIIFFIMFIDGDAYNDFKSEFD